VEIRSQAIETVLGKIAAKTGKPYRVKDFGRIPDLTEYAAQELKKHGMTDREVVIDPRTGRKVVDPSTGKDPLTGVRFFMKLMHTSECFDDQTEALTSEGWIPWPAVTPLHKLATVEKGCLIFERPICVVQLPSPGQLYCFEGRYVDYAVTGNHNLYARLPKGKLKFETAARLHGRTFSMPQSGFVPDAPKLTPGIAIGDRLYPWSDYAELVGWWAAEGYAKVLEGPKGGTAFITLYQSQSANPRFVEQIEALAERLGCRWTHYLSEGRILGVNLWDRPLAEHFKACGTHSHNKRLPRQLFDAPLEDRKRAWSAMLNGDGSRNITPTGDALRYSTISKGLADDFQELCVRIGLGAVVRKCKERKEQHLQQAYQVGVSLKRTVALVDGNRNRDGFKVRPYDGTIYCAEMRTGLLYVRRNGKPMLTGNSKIQGRGTGAYDADEAPAKGGVNGSKRLSLLESSALLSHGATGLISDGRLVRGQAHPEFWDRFMAGHAPPEPKVPKVYEKFLATMTAAGINPVRSGSKINLMALTDKDVDELAGGRSLLHAQTVDMRNGLAPVPGGLFDKGLTGSHGGDRWSKIDLAEPMLNPVFEKPALKLLDLTEKKFRDVMAGREKIGDLTGPKAISAALGNIDVPRALTQARHDVANRRGASRDDAVRKLGYLKSANSLGIHPRDWVLSKVPVLPPKYRPVSLMQGSGTPIVSDANYLYRELFDADKQVRAMREKVSDVGDEHLALYDAFKGVTGLGDPLQPKNQEKGVKGMLKQVFGPGSPKFGMVQRRLLSGPMEGVGRAVIVPDPDLGMDEIGIPETRAWDVYGPHLVRHMVRKGMPRLQAKLAIKDQNQGARAALLEVMKERPVVASRAPILHRYGAMAFWPKLVKGDAIRITPTSNTGFGADHDGDAMNYYVPFTDHAVRDAIDKMLPSRNLFSVARFKADNFVPSKEFAGGLYQASTARDASKPSRAFATVRDALRAYRRGELGVQDPIDIHEDHTEEGTA